MYLSVIEEYSICPPFIMNPDGIYLSIAHPPPPSPFPSTNMRYYMPHHPCLGLLLLQSVQAFSLHAWSGQQISHEPGYLILLGGGRGWHDVKPGLKEIPIA